MSDDFREAKYLAGYQASKLYVDPFRNGKGKMINICTHDTNNMEELSEKIGIKIMYLEAGKDTKTLKLTKLKRSEFGWDDTNTETFEVTEFTLAKIAQFLSYISSLDLPNLSKERIELGLDIDDPRLKEQLFTILQTPKGLQCLRELLDNEHLIALGDVQNIAHKREQLEIFRRLLQEPEYFHAMKTEWGKKRDEDVWQYYFEINTWIFGYGLNFIFNEPLNKTKLELYVKGSDIFSHGKRPDAVLRSRGLISSFCLVEIKKPTTKLLGSESRPGCWEMHSQLAEGITQSQVSCFETMKNFKLTLKDDDGFDTGDSIFAIEPKAYLIVGSFEQFKKDEMVNQDMVTSFELFRRKLFSPEIITFDELYERACFICNYKPNQE